MNIKLLEEKKSGLETLITDWLVKNKILNTESEKLEIDLKVTPLKVVSIKAVYKTDLSKISDETLASDIDFDLFCTRVSNCIRFACLETYGQLVRISMSRLRTYRGFGDKSVIETETALRKLGLGTELNILAGPKEKERYEGISFEKAQHMTSPHYNHINGLQELNNMTLKELVRLGRSGLKGLVSQDRDIARIECVLRSFGLIM